MSIQTIVSGTTLYTSQQRLIELVRAHGLRRCRYRGLLKTRWQACLTAIAFKPVRSDYPCLPFCLLLSLSFSTESHRSVLWG